MRARGIAVLLVGVLAVTGCSAGDDSADRDTDATPSGVGESPAPDAPTVEPSGAAVPELEDPVGRRQIVAEGWTMTLEMFPLQRDSGGLVLNARLIYDEAGPGGPPKDMLASDGAFSQVVGAPNGFRLIDKAGGKVYLPAQDENESSLCSPDLGGKEPAAGDQVYVSCLFGAPPESTTTVDVRAASFGVFDGVPVE
jgi:hypothetical protein